MTLNVGVVNGQDSQIRTKETDVSSIDAKKLQKYYPRSFGASYDQYFSTREEKKNKFGMPKFNLSTLATGLSACVSIGFLIYFFNMFRKPSEITKLVKNIEKNPNIPDAVKKKVLDAMQKITTEPFEAGTYKQFINDVAKLDFKPVEQKVVDIKAARNVLDKKIVGMDEVKKQVLNFLEERNYDITHKVNTADRGPLILCLDGKPGCGKTAVAEVIAEAMGKPFGRISLGGVSDAHAITGLEKGYKDSHPGSIIQRFIDTGRKDAVILLDEMDKMGLSREHGDPSAALLDLLEPKQCKKFTDKYLDFPYDVSDATFIITSNEKSKIPKPLLNRLRVIDVPSHDVKSKKELASRVMKKAFADANFPESIKFDDSALRAIAEKTSDYGARQTNQNCTDVVRQIKIDIQNNKPVSKIDAKYVTEALSKKNKSGAK